MGPVVEALRRDPNVSECLDLHETSLCLRSCCGDVGNFARVKIEFNHRTHHHRYRRQMMPLSRLDGWPMRSPVNASPRPSRVTAHDSGVDVVRYTFIVVDCHLLLLAG